MAQRHGISRQTVSEIWRAFGLKPWRQDEFKISPDPDLIEKIRDWVETWNDNPRPFTWHNRAEEILDRHAGYCRPLNN
jgi:hypothetical protein